MRRTSSGCAAARPPSKKNVARTSCFARTSSNRGVHVAFGPSSKVSANLAGPRRRRERRAEDPRTRRERCVRERARRQARARRGAEAHANSGRQRRDHSACQYAAAQLPEATTGPCAAHWMNTGICTPYILSVRLSLPVRLRPRLPRPAPPRSAAARAARWSAAPAARSSSRSRRSSTPTRTAGP